MAEVKKTVLPKKTEHGEQCALIAWANLMQSKYPELELLAAIPNGGKRDVVTGVRLKAEGVRAGFPDLILPVPRGVYAGLFLEMKVGRNKPTESQQWWLERLRQQGYRVCVCYGADEAMKVIKDYLQGMKWENFQIELTEWLAQKYGKTSE